MRRLAVLSLHTSPLAQPGLGDGGGMNVYVRELSSALARAGVECDVFTRAWTDDLPATVDIEPGFRVHYVSAGPPTPMAKEELPRVVEEFADGVLKRMQSSETLGPSEGLPFDAVHANYWLSGMAGHIIKHRLNLPLVSTFHTLDRVKAEASPEEVEADAFHQRAEAEATIIRCSDTILASCSVEAAQISEFYAADPSRIRIVAPGVDHAFFGPGDRVRPGAPSTFLATDPFSSSSDGSSPSRACLSRCAPSTPSPGTIPMPIWWWSAAPAARRAKPRWPGRLLWSPSSASRTG